MSGNASPDSTGPAGDGKQYSSSDWASADVNIASTTELGGLSRFILIPLDATAGNLVVVTAKGQERTFAVDAGWAVALQISKIKQSSTVDKVQVFV